MNLGFDPSMHRNSFKRDSFKPDSHRSNNHAVEQSIMSALPLIAQPDMKNIENAFVMSLRAKQALNRIKSGREIIPSEVPKLPPINLAKSIGARNKN